MSSSCIGAYFESWVKVLGSPRDQCRVNGLIFTSVYKIRALSFLFFLFGISFFCLSNFGRIVGSKIGYAHGTYCLDRPMQGQLGPLILVEQARKRGIRYLDYKSHIECISPSRSQIQYICALPLSK